MLEKLKAYIPPPNHETQLHQSNFSIIQVESIQEGLDIAQKQGLLSESTALITDSDGTLRDQSIEARHARFGGVPQDSVDLLWKLKQLGVSVAVITNQTGQGHCVAKFLSKNGTKYAIAPYIYYDLNIPVFHNKRIMRPGHKSRHGLNLAKLWLTNLSGIETLITAGDDRSDLRFAKKLQGIYETQLHFQIKGTGLISKTSSIVIGTGEVVAHKAENLSLQFQRLKLRITKDIRFKK